MNRVVNWLKQAEAQLDAWGRLLIMTLFAQAFGIAASSIKKQRGLAENDQRARSLVTILLGDLQKRTYRQRSDAILFARLSLD